MSKVGLLVRLVAKPGKEQIVADFIQGALALAQQEPDTLTWYAIRIDSSTFGIFDTFPGESGRQAHLNGPIAAALMANASELLAEPPKIEQIDILASK
ncbi:MAG: antibiotic biosynthesis monooxygenase [Saprospiraceae bacterium]